MQTEKNGKILTIFLEGELDAQSAPNAQDEIFKAIDNEDFEELIFDAEKLSYISSAGLRVILTVHKKIGTNIGKKVSVKKAPTQVADIFKIAGFQHFMDIEGA